MRRIVPALLTLLTALAGVAHAADPQPYAIEFRSAGDRDMDATLEAASDLASLRGPAPVSPFGLIVRARGDLDRLRTALESYGYYQCAVAIRIDDRPLGDPGLAEALAALPDGTAARVAVSFVTGPRYHLRRIDVDGDLPEDLRDALGLHSGDAAVAANVLAASSRLLDALQERGHAFARVDAPVAYEAADEPALDVSFHVVAGPRVAVGDIRFEGLQRMHERLLRDRVGLHRGEPYSASALERARRNLLALGIFSQVSVQLGAAPDDSGGVPVTFRVRERPRHAVAVNAAYSSDLGGSGGATWTDRNLFGDAQQLSLSASVINVGGIDTFGTGYDAGAKYQLPGVAGRDQTLQFTIGATRQSLQAYDQTAHTAGVTLSRRLSARWNTSVGATATDEQVFQQGVNRDYTLLAVPLNVAFDSTGLASPLDDPRRGLRASLGVTPTLAVGTPNATFVITQLKLAAYLDVGRLVAADPGRTVLAARALAGLAAGAGEFSLPPDQRFYGGGSGTIRGYGYQKVGPQFVDAAGNPSGIPIGGTAITAGSVELRQRFGTRFGAAVFIDAGQVSASLKAVPDQVRVGVGAGVRYYTPIGPIRLDLALPTHRRAADDRFEIYIGLGQAF